MDNLFLIKIPPFFPKYKKWKRYGYSNIKERENLKNVLEESSEGYCMYCYSKIRVDGKLHANLEHAIEKSNSEKLRECIPNIGLACATCNQSFKRAGEQKRKLPETQVEKFETESKCTCEKRKQCTKACKPLRNLQKYYGTLPGGKIIFQPTGIKGEQTGNELALEYDALKMQFQPATDTYDYSPEEKIFIQEHIVRFHLNDPKYKTRQLYEFVRDVVDHNGKIPEHEYDNWVVTQFKKSIQEKSKAEILKICRALFCISFLRG